MNLFYTNAIADGFALLSEAESKHAIQVMRMQKGDEINFIDGVGGFYSAVIQDPHPKKCVLRISNEKKEFEKLPYKLHLAVAPTKNIERFEWVLEKCTEMGIDSITPILCDRSERKIIKPERLERVILSAVKQSLKAYIPTLHPLVKFKDFIQTEFDSEKLIAHCHDSSKVELFSITKAARDYIILIGPEGDFTPEEVESAEANNFTSISIGQSRLRTETAAMVACSALYHHNL